MNRKKVTYIVSEIDKALAFEWVADKLSASKIDLSFVILGNQTTYLEKYLKNHDIPVKSYNINSRLSYLLVFLQLSVFLRHTKPDVIHCHLRVAELLGMPAAFFAGIQKRLYTRHSSTYNHLYHPKGVLFDRLTNFLATKIIAISENVKTILIEMENVPLNKITVIRHGFDLALFESAPEDILQKLRNKYSIPSTFPTIGIIARYTWWKGYKYSIPAIASVLKKYSDGHLIIANANGNHATEIKSLLQDYLKPHQYTEIKFEPNIQALYHLFDVYLHVPIDKSVEAFGQTYIEALAAGIPSVFTLSGIAPEFVRDNINALVVDFQNIAQIDHAVSKLLSSDKLRNNLIENGQKSIKMFALDNFINQLEDLYLSDV